MEKEKQNQDEQELTETEIEREWELAKADEKLINAATDNLNQRPESMKVIANNIWLDRFRKRKRVPKHIRELYEKAEAKARE
jgi:hypothetical protein